MEIICFLTKLGRGVVFSSIARTKCGQRGSVACDHTKNADYLERSMFEALKIDKKCSNFNGYASLKWISGTSCYKMIIFLYAFESNIEWY